MKKFCLAIGIGAILLLGSADAVARRGGATSVRQYFQSQNSISRSRWQKGFSLLRYRYHPIFVRSDYERWRELEALPENTGEDEDSMDEREFCNFSGSIIGQYLTTTEIENRCCECDDGWKCEYDSVAGNRPHKCSEGN